MDHEYLNTLFSSTTASWVQAIGSIAAIFGSYHLGSAAHRREQAQKAIDEMYRSKQKQSVLLEVFSLAESVDLLVRAHCEVPHRTSWRPVKALAEDLLSQCSSLPFFELPESDQIRELQLIRQAALTYIGYSTKIIASGIQPDEFYAHAAQFADESFAQAVISRKRSQAYLEELEHRISKSPKP